MNIIEKTLIFFKNNFFFIAWSIFLVFILIPFYSKGRMIAGGEGSYFLDFVTLFKNYGFSWVDYGTGIYQTSLSFAFVFHLIFLDWLIKDMRVVNFIMIYSIYFLPSLAMYLLALELRTSRLLAVLIAIFYVANPFSATYLSLINQWNVLSLYVLASFFLIIYKFLEKDFWLFFVFGINSFLFAFTNANPPLMAIYQIAIPLFLVVSIFIRGKGGNFLFFTKKYLVLLGSFLVFNFWWIFNWICVFADAQRNYNKQYAISWLRGDEKFIPAFSRIFNLTGNFGYPVTPGYNFFSSFYFNHWTKALLFLPLFLLLVGLSIACFKRTRVNNGLLVSSGLFLLFVFLAKGVRGLWGNIYEFLVMRFSLFSIFKSAEQKWGILVIFFLTLSLLFIFKANEGKQRSFLGLFVVFLVFCLFPFASLNFIPDYQFDFSQKLFATRQFLYKKDFGKLKDKLNQDKREYRILSFPGSANYQVALTQDDGRFYTGNDPVLTNTNKSFIAPYNGTFSKTFPQLYTSISRQNYFDLLGIYNIGKVILNKDVYPWFGFYEQENQARLKELFKENLTCDENETFLVCDNQLNFLPRFYPAQQVVWSPFNTDENLHFINSLEDFPQNTAYLFGQKEFNLENLEVVSDVVDQVESELILMAETQVYIDEAKLRSGVRGLNPGGVLFPYARWHPDGPIYRFIREKEERELDQALDFDLDSYFDKNIFFASKRIYEIQKWINSMDKKIFIQVFEDYEERMDRALVTLEEIIDSNLGDPFGYLARFEVTLAAHQQRVVDVLAGAEKEDDLAYKKELFNKYFLDLDKRILKIIKDNFSETTYRTIAPREGDYEFFIEDLGGKTWNLISLKEKEGEQYFFQKSLRKRKVENGEWFYLGNYFLPKGEKIIEMKVSSTNLLSDDWQTPSRTDFSTKETEHLSGSYSFGDLIAFQLIDNWEKRSLYHFSLVGSTSRGELRAMVIEGTPEALINMEANLALGRQTSDFRILADQVITSEDKWQNIDVTLRSTLFHQARLVLLTNSDLVDFELGEIRLERIAEPKLIVKKVNDGIEKFNLRSPRVSFKKLNNTKYSVEIKNLTNPFLLVFSESFHRNWKAYPLTKNEDFFIFPNLEKENWQYLDGKVTEFAGQDNLFPKNLILGWFNEPISASNHLLVNGYANAWLIEPDLANEDGDLFLVIEYEPQRFFYLGLVLSGLILVILIFLLFFLKVSSRNKNVKK